MIYNERQQQATKIKLALGGGPRCKKLQGGYLRRDTGKIPMGRLKASLIDGLQARHYLGWSDDVYAYQPSRQITEMGKWVMLQCSLFRLLSVGPFEGYDACGENPKPCLSEGTYRGLCAAPTPCRLPLSCHGRLVITLEVRNFWTLSKTVSNKDYSDYRLSFTFNKF